MLLAKIVCSSSTSSAGCALGSGSMPTCPQANTHMHTSMCAKASLSVCSACKLACPTFQAIRAGTLNRCCVVSFGDLRNPGEAAYGVQPPGPP